jgi:hypothetical protein
MNTFLNLYHEFYCDRYEMMRQIECIKKMPLIERIYYRGNKEQYSAKYRVHYGSSCTKRLSRKYTHNSLLLSL